MSTEQVEINRIAAQLAVSVDELGYLRSASLAALTELRKSIAVSTIDQHKKLFERMARASALLPGAIAARIAEEMLGAEMIANLTPFMAPDRAAAISKRMSVSFQADVAVHMIPESCSELLATLDADVRIAVTRELLRRAEFAVMGTVVDYLPVAVVESLALEISEPSALLFITGFVQDKSRLKNVTRRFDNQTLSMLVQIAEREAMMDVLIELECQLDDEERERIRSRREEIHRSAATPA